MDQGLLSLGLALCPNENCQITTCGPNEELDETSGCPECVPVTLDELEELTLDEQEKL